MPRLIHTCIFIFIISALLCACQSTPALMATVTPLSTPTFTVTQTITPQPTLTITEVSTPSQETIAQLQKVGITVERQNGRTILTTQNAKGEREVLPGTVEKAEGKWVLATDYKGVDGVAKTAIALDSLQKYHNEELKQDEIAGPMEGVDFARGRFTFIPAYYQAKGIAGHWVEDKVSAVGPLLVNPRYLFDGEIKVKDEGAANRHYKKVMGSLIRLSLMWDGVVNPDPAEVARYVELAKKNQLPANIKDSMLIVRSGGEVNENKDGKVIGSGMFYFQMGSLGEVDTSKLAISTLYTNEITNKYGGIRSTDNPAITIDGGGFAGSVSSFEKIIINGEEITGITISGYYNFTENDIKTMSDKRLVLPFQKPDGVSTYREISNLVNSANVNLYRVEEMTPVLEDVYVADNNVPDDSPSYQKFLKNDHASQISDLKGLEDPLFTPSL